MVTAIAFPKSLDVADCVSFCCTLDRLPLGDYGIDFSDFKHAPPFGMLLAASTVRRFVGRMRESGRTVRANKFRNKTYPAHMGFFRACGLDHGKEPGQATGSGTYVPLSKINVDPHSSTAHIHNTLNKQATRLARMLLPQGDGDALARLHYCLFEVMRNVTEHSGSPTIWFGAQAWPQSGTVEVGILDEGIGIRRSLAEKYGVASDAEAVSMAVQEGVSGSALSADPSGFGPQQGVDVDAEESRESRCNSGYGLFVVSEMCREEGAFSLVSGDSCLCMEAQRRQVIDAAHRGVAVRAFLRTGGEAIATFIRRIATKKYGETPSTKPAPMLDG